MIRRTIVALGDQLRHFLLNPPLAPGGNGGVGVVVSTETIVAGHDDGIGDVAATTSPPNNDPLILRYIPLMVLLALFWPVLLTLIAASISASAWLFWLCVGIIFGILQLLYVLYNFMMIFSDLGALTLLKTFAMLRSFIRYYFYKMGDAAGIEIKGKKERGKKRRRKEWREEVDRANSYKEYCKIELYEPQHQVGSAKTTSSKPKYVRRSVSIDRTESGLSSVTTSGFGLRLRKLTTSPTIKITPSTSNNHPNSPLRKTHSSNELNETPKSGSQRQESVFRNNSTQAVGNGSYSRVFPLRRVSSSALPLSRPNDEEDNYLNGEESCPKWQKVVKEDLGMTGSMLLTTLSRLKEARMQASKMSVHSHSSSDDNTLRMFHKNNKRNCTDFQESNSLRDGVIETAGGREPVFNITSFTTSSSPEKQRSRDEDSYSSLKTLLSGIVKRNHLSVDDFLMQDARSVEERGQHSLKKETRQAIDRYGEEVARCIDWVASGAVCLGNNVFGDAHGKSLESQQDKPNNIGNKQEQIIQKQRDDLSKRYTLFKRMKQNMGHTALMLSGGGAQAMYHLGTIKALVESELYQHIHVISGTSGGSISAAICAIKSPDELLRDVCVNTVSTDYMLTGEMKKKRISWFPELYKMGAYWLKNRLLMDSKEFLRCCQFYYSDITFEEAFEMTGKHVCITVSASRASAGSGVQRLLLNHISTPNVTLASAVAASCAVPGVMAPAKLMIMDSHGKQVPFEVDGVEWIDGSVQADLPFKRISTLFNISNFVVAQTNFHVVPFLNKAHHPNINTLYWKMFSMCMWDVRSRVLNLSALGLFPKIFGQDLSKMFRQKYFGKLTLVPRFTTLQLFGLKVLSNPTVADMDVYLQNGQLAAWPFLRVLKEMLRIERSIDAGLAKLHKRLHDLASGFDFSLPNDDVDSLSSIVGITYRARLPGLGREAELLKEKVRSLEQENKMLRQQVLRLQCSLGVSHSVGSATLEGRLVSVSLLEKDGNVSHSDENKKS